MTAFYCVVNGKIHKTLNGIIHSKQWIIMIQITVNPIDNSDSNKLFNVHILCI